MKTVLIADDEDFLRLLVKETLDRYKVLEARNGDEAVEMAREVRPDLLILDWMMPGMDGPAVLEALRADPETSGLRVLMVTARLGSAEKEQLQQAGASDCLSKPFSPAELCSKVDDLLASSESADPSD